MRWLEAVLTARVYAGIRVFVLYLSTVGDTENIFLRRAACKGSYICMRRACNAVR